MDFTYNAAANGNNESKAAKQHALRVGTFLKTIKVNLSM
jgi:hypothetical protein